MKSYSTLTIGGTIAFLLASFPLLAFSTPLQTEYPAFPKSHRRATARNPQDQSWVKKFAALGDSFSSGIKAGDRLSGWGDYLCSRYDQAYGALMSGDERMGGPDGHEFTFWACSGYTTDQVTKTASSLSGDQDVITFTAGGNDAYFSEIINECIFQWNSHSSGFTDYCNTQLGKAEGVIKSSGFHAKLDKLISTAKSKLSSSGSIYYLGYPYLWGATDDQCDSVTWSYFYIPPWEKQYLTLAHRTRMNSLTDLMNSQIEAAVGRGGSNVVFVNPATYFARLKGQFCENGYPETRHGNANRAGLLLYEWYTDDNVAPGTADATNTPLTRSGDPVMNGTFEGQINEFARQTMAKYHNLTTSNSVGPIGPGLSVGDLNATPDQLVQGYSPSVLPDSYRGICHPRPSAHSLFANLIFYYMEVTRAKTFGQTVAQPLVWSDTCPNPAVHPFSGGTPTPSPSPSPGSKSFCTAFQDPDNCNPGGCVCPEGTSYGTYSFGSSGVACPYKTLPPKSLSITSKPHCASATPTPGPTATRSPNSNVCVGNQIQGSCTPAAIPTGSFNGESPPVCIKVDSSQNDWLRVNATQSLNAATSYCQSLANNKVVLDGTTSNPNPYIVPKAAENGGQLALAVLYFRESCPKDHSTSTLDFTKLTLDECVNYAYTSISQMCSQDSTWSDYNPDYTLEGGTFPAACGLWSLAGEPAQT